MSSEGRHLGRRVRPAAMRQGQAVTEFALITPILIGLVLAIIQFGALMINKSAVTFAAREGARVASIHGAEPDANTQVCAAIVRALSSSGANTSYLGPVLIYRANQSDFAASAARTDNPNAHDVGTCTGGTWTYTAPWNSQNLSYPPYQRNIIIPTDRIGVSLSYTYHFIVPLFGGTLTWQDADILQMEPQYAQGSSGVTAPTVAPTYTVVPYPTATCQPTQQPYPTFTPTATPTTTPTATSTGTATGTPTGTPSDTPTGTPSATPTGTPTPSPSTTATATGTATATFTPVVIVTPSATPTMTPGGC